MGAKPSAARTPYQGHVSWADVLRYWEALQRQYGHKPVVVAELVQSVTGAGALRGIVGCPCNPGISASFIFGPGSPDGGKTLPSALLEALRVLDVAWETQADVEREVAQIWEQQQVGDD